MRKLLRKLRKNIDILYNDSKEFDQLWDDSSIESIKYWKIFQIEHNDIRESDKIGCLLITLSMCSCVMQNIGSYNCFDPKEILKVLNEVNYDEESEYVKELIDLNKKWLRIRSEGTFGFTMVECEVLYKMRKYVFNKFIRPVVQVNTTV